MPKQRKKVYGSGSVYQRKTSDQRWVASFIVEETGKRKYLYADSQKEAEALLQKALREQEQGTLVTGPQQKFGDFLNRWLEEVHKPMIRISSYANYRNLLDKHILPALGHIRLQKLTAFQIESFYARKLKDGIAPATVQLMHAVLHKSLDYAVLRGFVPRNVSDTVSSPRKERHEIQTLTPEQAQHLLEVAHDHRLEALLTVALATGMRRGEILALRWKDINLEKRHLQIRHTVGHVAGHGYIETEPKTKRSRRSLILPQKVIDALHHHYLTQLEEQKKAGASWEDHDLVFSNKHGGYLSSGTLFHMFTVLLKDAGLPHMRFHDLRHSAATILLTMGIHPKVVQELLGHSTISMTMDIYSHVLPSMQQDAMDKWDNLFQ